MKLIRKGYTAMCGHRLTAGVPKNHPCRREHGHNYRFEVTVHGLVSPITGMVIEYAELDAVVDEIVAFIDHRHLNKTKSSKGMRRPKLFDVVRANPTVENLAFWFKAELFERLSKWGLERWCSVRIEEDDRSAVEL